MVHSRKHISWSSHECILLPSCIYNMHQDTKSAQLIVVCKRTFTYFCILLCICYCFIHMIGLHSVTWLSLLYKFTRFFIYFLFLSDEGSMLETLDYTIRVGSTPTFLYFDLYLYSAYTVHHAFISIKFCRECERRDQTRTTRVKTIKISQFVMRGISEVLTILRKSDPISQARPLSYFKAGGASRISHAAG